MNTNKTLKDVIESGYGLPTVIVSHIMDKGWELCASATDEEIDALDGNPVMTKDFVQWIIRTARDVCANFDMFNDFIPYIANELPVRSIDRHVVSIKHNEVADWKWEEICDEIYAYDEDGNEPKSIEMIITHIKPAYDNQ